MNIIWSAGALLCMLYFAVLTVYGGAFVDASWIWLALGAVMLLSGWIFRRTQMGIFPAAVRGITLMAWLIGIALLAWYLAGILSHMRDDTQKDLDYVIVLGAQVKGTVPSRSLDRRIRRAYTYIEEHPNSILILSGGKGSGEDISEAESMYRAFKGYGLDESRMTLEDASTNTRENFVFSDRLTGCAEKSCGIVSNDFHICRALRIAKMCGYQDVYGIAAPSDPVMELHFVMREVAALLYMDLRNLI